MDNNNSAPLLSDEISRIEREAYKMRAEAYSAMFAALGNVILRVAKAPAKLLRRSHATA
ncbi:RSP_7527 family protein [Phaeobacter sp. HF9A]|uniref:RSP_7527 family protein n=1 Tax=Phaeobacter sp. HF9A TaxID=2721561 RepID=UPI00142F591E|nr:hypothetical protein [Phaeobacter sp. HF9A]NIZ13701.1 hypothetical protein [Phaeobacter sp. HF9A]